MLKREDDKSTAVVIGNPRSTDFEVCESHLVFLSTWETDLNMTHARNYLNYVCFHKHLK